MAATLARLYGRPADVFNWNSLTATPRPAPKSSALVILNDPPGFAEHFYLSSSLLLPQATFCLSCSLSVVAKIWLGGHCEVSAPLRVLIAGISVLR